MLSRLFLTKFALRTSKQPKYFFTRIIRRQVDYYKVLQISPYATPEQIKNNYYSLSNNYNPDLSQDSQEHMVKLNQAYDVLSNQSQREKYNLQRGIPKQPVAQNKYQKQQKLQIQNIQSSPGKYSWRQLRFYLALGVVIAAIFDFTFGLRQQEAYKPVQQSQGNNVQTKQVQDPQGTNENTVSGNKQNRS